MGARGLARMPENEWTLVDAAASIQFDGERGIQRAWRDPGFPFRGAPHAIPRTREPIEIPFADRRRLVLDCRGKRAGKPRLWDYELVEMRTADIKRLPQEARTPSPQPPRTAKTFVAPNQRTYYSIVRGRVVSTAPDFPTVATNVANTPVSEESPEQLPQRASTAKTRAHKANSKVMKAVNVLLNRWPQRPYIGVQLMLAFVRTEIEPCSKSTVERAIKWLEERKKWVRPSIPRLD
jgi:hypothetical protein